MPIIRRKSGAEKYFAGKLVKRLNEKQNRLDKQPGILGNGQGQVTVAGLLNFVYVSIGDKSLPVFNNRVIPQAGVKVWVGYSDEEPTLYQVLSTRSDAPSQANDGGFTGYAPAKRYEWLATNGGQDPLHVHNRAITFLKLGVSAQGGMYVNVFRGFVWTGATFLHFPSTDTDLTSYIPATANKAAFVLVTIDTAGALVFTDGADVDIDLLDADTDIPTPPAGTVFVCGAVRVYNGQTAVREARTNSDIVDLRFTPFNNGLTNPLTADLDFAGYKAIAMACDNGATLPATPSQGQWFLHTPTGRNILLQYVGGAWTPIFAFGSTLDIYVDVLGSDVADKGYGSGANAFLTIGYALTQIPPVGDCDVTINVGAGTFAESVVADSKRYPSFTIVGTLSTSSSGVSSAIGKGAGNIRPFLTVASPTWGTDDQIGKLIDPGDGALRVIERNTSTQVFLTSPMSTTIAAGTAFTIYDHATIIDTSSGQSNFTNNGMATTVEKIKVIGSPSSASLITASQGGALNLTLCAVVPSSAKHCFNIPSGVNAEIDTSYFEVETDRSVFLSTGGNIVIRGTLFYKTGLVKNGTAIFVTNGESLNISQSGNVFNGFASAIVTSGFIQGTIVSANGNNYFKNNITAISISTGGIYLVSTQTPQFETNGANISHAWNLGETTFARQGSGMTNTLTVSHPAQLQELKAQTAAIGETKTDVQGDGKRIYGVAHVTEGIEPPTSPALGDMWVDTN